jgi:hypothetical protein
MNLSYNTSLAVDSTFEMKYQMFVDNNSNFNIRIYKFKQIWIPESKLNDMITALTQLGYITHVAYRTVYFQNADSIGYFNLNSSGMDDGVLYYTSNTDLDKIINVIDVVADFSKKIEIRWITDTNGNYSNIIEIVDDVVSDTIYPYVPNGVNAYIEDFLQSKSSILILLGPPGTGKTGFIRHILSMLDKKAYVTYNEQVFKGDSVFADFMSSTSSGAFVIEDADLLLRSRESGNELMSKFLNIGDGIIRMNGKKLIFSTNLPSTKDIDPAILRAGRCYDALHFRPLTLDEANVACREYELEEFTENKEYKLTEIFNRRIIKKQRTVGFI